MKKWLNRVYLRILFHLCVRTAYKWFKENPQAYIFTGGSPRYYIDGPKEGQIHYIQGKYSNDLKELYTVINYRKGDVQNWLRRRGLRVRRDSGHDFTVCVAREALRRVSLECNRCLGDYEERVRSIC